MNNNPWVKNGSTARDDSAQKSANTSGKFTLIVVLLFVATYAAACTEVHSDEKQMTTNQKMNEFDSRIDQNAQQMLEQGRQIFRFETFGDEAYWSDKLKLHRAIAGAKLGGVGPGLSPKAALAVGLKVDMDALPADLVEKVKKGGVNLDDPATTLTLIKLDSVLGVKGTFKPSEIGIDDFQSNRSPDNSYRTAPLRGLFAHTKGGFYHDGRFATLLDVVNHYNNFKKLTLTEQEKKELVEFLKSL